VIRRQLASGSPAFDVVGAVNRLRQLIAKAEAFVTTADDQFEEIRNNRRRQERLAWVVTEAASAARAALAACNKLAEELGQLVDDRIDVLAERAGCDGVVEMADEVSRRCGVVQESLEGGTVEGELGHRNNAMGIVLSHQEVKRCPMVPT